MIIRNLKPWLSTLFLCLLVMGLNAQNNVPFPDRLALKNGSVLKCKVLEYQPDTLIKVEVMGGSTFVYQATEIKEVTINAYVLKMPADTSSYHIQQKGFFVDCGLDFLGGLIDQSFGLSPTVGVAMRLSTGYSINRHLKLAAGVAFCTMDNSFMFSSHVPVFGELKGDIYGKKSVIYYKMAGGYNFAQMRNNENTRSTLRMTDAKGGLYLRPAIGYRFASKEHSHVNLEFGYAIHKAQYEYFGTLGGEVMSTNNTFVRPFLGVGMEF